jgi:formate transporter
MNNDTQSFDALIPRAMAERAEQIGIRKAKSDFLTLFVLSILAGAFISLGAIFSTTVSAGASGVLPFGIVRLLMGSSFTLGLVLVIVGGAELFTGNMLVSMAFASGKVSLWALLRNWGIVYLGNFLSSVATALIVFWSKQYAFGGGAMGANMLAIGEAKTNLGFVQAVMLGLLCNAMVCLAVWMTYSARSTTDKILAIFLPIAGFVAAGFEHSIANMYFIPVALFVKYGGDQAFFTAIGKTAESYPHLTWGNFFLVNLLPVTIGNIIGGAVMVGLVYWFVYLRNAKK